VIYKGRLQNWVVIIAELLRLVCCLLLVIYGHHVFVRNRAHLQLLSGSGLL
jgi:TRAP-type C4-dicarboxylate transport system permease small subunit